MGNFAQSGTLLLALGGNVRGRWGAPADSLRAACRALEKAGLRIIAASHLYRTAPVGGGGQPPYLNAVIAVKGSISPAGMLRLAKQIERRAGRKIAPRWSARPLDIDMLDFGGRRLGRPARGRDRGRLVLPHPLLQDRAFVLVPLAEIAPHWWHPVLGRQARTLLARLPPRLKLGVRLALDFRVDACEKAAR